MLSDNTLHTKQKEALAMVFDQIGQPFVPRRIEKPVLQPGEIIVRIIYTTICTSDLHTFFGRRGAPSPSILGHEIMGKVENIGPGGVADYYGKPLQQGDTITWSVYAHDHEGAMARKGIPQKSPGLFKYGHEKLNGKGSLSGGFATHCLLRKGTDIFKLPETLHPKEAAPLNCTHATIAGALRLAGSFKDKNVLVIGAGMLGLSACAMSREAGARRVWVSDLIEGRLQKALEFGGDKSLDGRLPVEDMVKQVKQEGGVDVVIETSGVPIAMEKGLSLLNIGGISVWVGAVYAQRDLAVNAEKIVRNILTIKGLHNYIPQDLDEAIRFLETHKNKYPFKKLVGREFYLPDLDQAFKMADMQGYYRIGVKPGRE